MSDFERVLERLLVDPAFKAALAADPDRALAGYALAPGGARDAGPAGLHLGRQLARRRGAQQQVRRGRPGRAGRDGVRRGRGPASRLGAARHLDVRVHQPAGFRGGTDAGDELRPGPAVGRGDELRCGARGGSSFGEAARSDGDTSFGDGQEPTESFGTVRGHPGSGRRARAGPRRGHRLPHPGRCGR